MEVGSGVHDAIVVGWSMVRMASVRDYMTYLKSLSIIVYPTRWIGVVIKGLEQNRGAFPHR